MLRTCLFLVPWLFFAVPAFANDDDLRAVDVLPREFLARADGSSRLRNINNGLTAGIAGTLRISKGGLDDRNSKTKGMTNQTCQRHRQRENNAPTKHQCQWHTRQKLVHRELS